MEREVGYYWVRYKDSAKAEWLVRKWDGLRFVSYGGLPIRAHLLEIDERRIVRREVGDGKKQTGTDGDSG